MMYAAKTLDVSSPCKAVLLRYLSPVLYLLASLIILVPARAQGVGPNQSNSFLAESYSALQPGGFLHPTLPGCRNATSNDLRGRVCYYANDLLGPSAVAHALFSSSFSELRNSPDIWHQDRDDTIDRFAFFYEQKSARDAGEFLVGYLHRENFRPALSGKTGFRARTKEALLGVVRTPNGNGATELALAPIAGALGAGFVRAADYRNHDLLLTGMRCSAVTYGFEFGSAVFQEFKPDLLNFSNKLVNRFR